MNTHWFLWFEFSNLVLHLLQIVSGENEPLTACVLHWAAAEARSSAGGYATLLTFVRPLMLTVFKFLLYILIPSPQPLLTSALPITTLKMWYAY